MQVTDKDNLIEFHEMTGIFPMMDNEALDKLADDILINGLLEPIIMFDGKIVDGRNRYMACLDAEVEPQFVEWNGGESELVDYIVSKNLHRRHLTPSQKAMAAAKAKDLHKKLKEEARKRSNSNLKRGTEFPEGGTISPVGKGREILAELFDTNDHYVQDALTILEKAPDLVNLVESGRITIPKARKEIDRRERAFENRKYDLEGKYDILYAEFPKGTLYEDIEEMAHNIKSICKDNSVLFLWTPSVSLDKMIKIVSVWGFIYRNCIVWDKGNGTKGKFVKNNHELLLIADKGELYPKDPAQFESIWRIEPDGNLHPEECLRRVQQLYPESSIIRVDRPDKKAKVEEEVNDGDSTNWNIGKDDSMSTGRKVETAPSQDDLELQRYLDKYKDL